MFMRNFLLHRAVNRGDAAAASRHTRGGADPNRGVFGNPAPLFVAVQNEDTAMTEALLSCGANPDLSSSTLGITPLMTAVTENTGSSIVALLLAKGANPDLQNQQGETALHMCVNLGKPDMAKLLIEAGADVNLGDRDGVTCLNLARSFHGLSDLADMLLAAGADPRKKDRHGKVYLM